MHVRLRTFADFWAFKLKSVLFLNLIDFHSQGLSGLYAEM